MWLPYLICECPKTINNCCHIIGCVCTLFNDTEMMLTFTVMLSVLAGLHYVACMYSVYMLVAELQEQYYCV